MFPSELLVPFSFFFFCILHHVLSEGKVKFERKLNAANENFWYLNCHCKFANFCWLRKTDIFQTAL